MINLKDCTFIIPVFIDSEDRINNFRLTLRFLRKYFDTNIIVYEVGPEPKIKDTSQFLYFYEHSNDPIFHRTKYLNRMLSFSGTLITCNHDTDILAPPESYALACEKIRNNEFDFVYPYGLGNFQFEIGREGRAALQANDCDLDSIAAFPPEYFTLRDYYTESGHCCFIRTATYKRFWGENELFVSYGPEDQERYHRFEKFCRLAHVGGKIYHLQHERLTNSSGELNPHAANNWYWAKLLVRLSREDLIQFYARQSYWKNYDWQCLQ